ncbi:MAG: acyl-CoA synthetase FdrA [Anaerolineales bacterium]|nr:MAG: acyl-CoA synthetase FdrA [Anaerolineales bacterium]
MSTTKSEVRPGAYYDSVVLMQLQRKLAALPGVEDAGVVMATPANLELLADSNLLEAAGKAARPEDLLIVVRAASETEASTALSQVDELLKQRSSGGGNQSYRPRSLDAGVRNLPAAEWVLISVPGRYAAKVAHEALDHGKHVFLYSDNVELSDEIALKQRAAELGLLVMGPDCGTAIINGVGLGFANRVRRGPVGLVGASGTGLQALTVGIHNYGGGVSQAIGTGGRDLKAEVGAASMLQGLRYLAADESTKVIVLVSKPPDEQTSARLLTVAQSAGKPVVVAFIGFAAPAEQIGNVHFATGLDSAARIAVALSEDAISPTAVEPRTGYLRGLFAGGTLAYEALNGLQNFLHPLYSNVAIRNSQKLADPLHSQAHTIIDLGEDVFTVGRLHPMMDNDLRLRRLKQESEGPEIGLILLDIVLGEGAHADPASELAPAIEAHCKARPDLEFVALVVGTDDDPQHTSEQIAKLEAAGARIFRETSQAVDYVAARLAVAPSSAAKPLQPFGEPLAAINVGVESFYDSLQAQGAHAVQVDWRPPAGGNESLASILEKMKGK